MLDSAMTRRQGMFRASSRLTGSLEDADILIISEKPTLRKGKPFYPRHTKSDVDKYLNFVLETGNIPEYKLLWTDIESGYPEELLKKYALQPICFGHNVYRALVTDSHSYDLYNKPDCHSTPERDYETKGSTTFFNRLISQINRHLGE